MIYAVRVRGTSGHQRNNDAWPIGAFIKRCHHMIESVTTAPSFLCPFYEDREKAEALLKFAEERFAPHVQFEIVRFRETIR